MFGLEAFRCNTFRERRSESVASCHTLGWPISIACRVPLEARHEHRLLLAPETEVGRDPQRQMLHSLPIMRVGFGESTPLGLDVAHDGIRSRVKPVAEALRSVVSATDLLNDDIENLALLCHNVQHVK